MGVCLSARLGFSTLCVVALVAIAARAEAQLELRGPSRKVGSVVVRERTRADGTLVRLFYRPADPGAGRGVRIEGREGLYRIAGSSLIASGGVRRLRVRPTGNGVQVRVDSPAGSSLLEGRSAIAALQGFFSTRVQSGPEPEPGRVVSSSRSPREVRPLLKATDRWVPLGRLPTGSVPVQRDLSGALYIESLSPSPLNRGFQRVGLRWTEAGRSTKRPDLVGFLYSWPATGFDARLLGGEVHVRMNIRLVDGTGYGEDALRSLAGYLGGQIEKVWDNRVALVDPKRPGRALPVRFSIRFHLEPRAGEHAAVTITDAGYADDHLNWSIAANPGAAAHEIGHHLGNLDEYADRGQWPLRPASDEPSVMRGSASTAANGPPLARHFKAVAAWLSTELGRTLELRTLGAQPTVAR